MHSTEGEHGRRRSVCGGLGGERRLSLHPESLQLSSSPPPPPWPRSPACPASPWHSVSSAVPASSLAAAARPPVQPGALFETPKSYHVFSLLTFQGLRWRLISQNSDLSHGPMILFRQPRCVAQRRGRGLSVTTSASCTAIAPVCSCFLQSVAPQNLPSSPAPHPTPFQNSLLNGTSPSGRRGSASPQWGAHTPPGLGAHFPRGSHSATIAFNDPRLYHLHLRLARSAGKGKQQLRALGAACGRISTGAQDSMGAWVLMGRVRLCT